MFVQEPRNQSSLNRFFNRQNFDLAQLNDRRLEMLQQLEGTRFKARAGKQKGGVLSVDNSLLKHYGKHFDNIYCHYDYVHIGYGLCKFSINSVCIKSRRDESSLPGPNRVEWRFSPAPKGPLCGKDDRFFFHLLRSYIKPC